MVYRVSIKDKNIEGAIVLPSSKSISNRLLMIRALSGQGFSIKNLSEADDTARMEKVLSSKEKVLDCGPAGTVMRFLTAYYALQPGIHILTGSERMKKRPVSQLVECLRKMGAEIRYMEKGGYPPLEITGVQLPGGEAEIDASVSSQFISALLMIAPRLKHGLKLNLKSEIVSRPYINMTLQLLKEFGIESEFRINSISIAPQEFKTKEYSVEPDWSAASYWYLMAALANKASLSFPGLYLNSIQGDAITADLFRKFGVVTVETEKGIKIINKKQIAQTTFTHDFSACPDLAQTFAVACAGTGFNGCLKGLQTLKIKETNRLTALKNELEKTGVKIRINNNDELLIDGEIFTEENAPVFKTYADHRMAMSLAALAFKSSAVFIEDPMVVSKSYPGFWDDLSNTGFQVEGC